jgi:hypothetical protein
MRDPKAETVFTWLDRGFWLIWLGFPVLVWTIVQGILAAPAQLAAQLPDQADCIAALPNVATLGPLAGWAFWGGFAVEMAAYALVLGLAHSVIHRCAMGRIFVDGMIRTLKRIGAIIALFPVLDLILGNLTAWALYVGGDVAVYQASVALDLPVLAVGLLLVAMAYAMRQAVRLQQDAALTI